MQGFKVFVKSVLVVLLVLFSLAYCVGVAVYTTVLSPSYYTGLFEEADFAQSLHRDMAEAFALLLSEQIEQDAEDLLPNGTDISPGTGKHIESFANAVSRTYSPQWLETQMRAVLDDFTAFVDGRQATLTAVIPLGQSREALKQNFEQELRSLSTQELAEIGVKPQDIGSVASAFVDALPIPDEIRLQDVFDVHVHGHWSYVASGVQAFKSALMFVPYIVFGLFLLLFILLGKVPGGLIWFGSGLAASGLFFGAMVLAMRGALNQAMEIADSVFLRFESLSALADYTVAHVIAAPIVLTVVGVALIVLGVVLTRKRYGGASAPPGTPAEA